MDVPGLRRAPLVTISMRAPVVATAPWQELLERSPLGVIVHDEHDRVVHVNASFARFLGYSKPKYAT